MARKYETGRYKKNRMVYGMNYGLTYGDRKTAVLIDIIGIPQQVLWRINYLYIDKAVKCVIRLRFRDEYKRYKKKAHSS